MKSLDNIRLIFFIILGLAAGNIVVAQEPAWVNDNQRQELYPESEFLVGFVSGNSSQDEDPGELKANYEVFAREQVVQHIIVTIETTNALYTSEVDGESNEQYLSKTVSISKAEINGLKSASYYDKKKRKVYGLAYVNKQELVYYYTQLVELLSD